ncbi:MAG: type II secretion system protein GspC [Deltaproteobacteria bacterium]|nr:type II secretion system protein GspC [Deltaproteobacteria bacterium]
MSELIKQYLWILDLLAVVLCAFFGAKLVSTYLGEVIEMDGARLQSGAPVVSMAAESGPPPASDYKIIVARNVFDSTELPPEVPPADAAMAVPTGEAVKTGLSIRVVGVLVVGAGTDERSSATIEGGERGAVDTYSVGTENGFAPNTKLTRVQPDRIVFVNSGRLEYALIEEETGGNIFGPPVETVAAIPETRPQAPAGPAQAIKKTGENKFVIDQKEVQNALGNVERLYTEIRAVPNFAGGKVSGMKILSVKQGSLFDKLGLQRGDILEKINGMELDVKRGFEIFNTLKDEKRLTLDLVRQGSNQTFEYEIR